jgi:hypothetical protein
MPSKMFTNLIKRHVGQQGVGRDIRHNKKTVGRLIN